MNLTTHLDGDVLTVALNGHLDAVSAPALEDQLSVKGIRELALDLAACPFVSSAGLRAILSLHRRMTEAGGRLVVRDPIAAVREVFEITGLSKFLAIARTPREISIEGLEMLSSGVCGECFRLDRETVVKLYKEGVAPDIAEQEKRFAKAAFVMGIPTAISYDVVRCGTRSGIVFELLDAELFSAVIRREPHDVDRHAKRLSDLCQALHAATGDRSILPDLKERFRDYIRQLDGTLAPHESAVLLDRLQALPDAETCVHFDLHSSNIMVQKGELVIIDMGDFSIGSNLFDIGLIYMIYGVPELGMCTMATKIDAALGLEFWNRFAEHYFADRRPEERAFFEANRHFLASLRIIYAITYLTHLRGELVRLLKQVLLPRIMERSPA